MTEENTERNYESEASQQGWKPEEDFSGDPERWVDAQTFVERGEQFVGLMKPRLDKLEKQLKYQEKLNTDMKGYVDAQERRSQKEVKELQAQLKDTRKRAIATGDGEAFEKADEQLKELDAQPTAPPQEQPWVTEWLGENSWYNSDTTLRVVADNYSDQLRMLNPSLTEKEFLDKVSEHVKAEMPHKFVNPNSRQSPDVEGDGGRLSGGGDSTAQTYKNLPPEAKATCTRLIKEGIISDKEEYATLYFED